MQNRDLVGITKRFTPQIMPEVITLSNFHLFHTKKEPLKGSF